MDNKLITVTSPLMPDLTEFNELLKDIWSRKWLTNNGHYHQELEKALSVFEGTIYKSLYKRNITTYYSITGITHYR